MSSTTKLEILKGLFDLLEDQDLDKITVTMLVEKCGISRQTFYYHFSDIEDLVDWGIIKSTDICIKKAKSAADIKEATLIPLYEIEKYRTALKKCFLSSFSCGFLTLMRNCIMNYETEFYAKKSPELVETSRSKFVIEFTANGVIGFVLSYVFHSDETDLEKLANDINVYVLQKLV